MKPTGHTQPFAVLGHPIGHTLSPIMHNAAFQALGMDAIYLAFDVAPERLMRVLPVMAEMGFRGINLTVPLKETACRGLAQLDGSARMLGAVNTVEILPDGLRGHNTDAEGFVLGVREAFDGAVAGRAVLVLGCGGAGRAVALACATNGAARVWLSDADSARAAALAEAVRAANPALPVTVAAAQPDVWTSASREADLVVQATPVGMRPDDPPLLPPQAFRRGQWVYDLIYMFPETAFLRAAREGGARTANGLGMLLHQGARALTIWTGRAAPVAVMRTALEQAVYGSTA